MVFNKIDNYKWIEKDPFDLSQPTKENISLEELQNTWMSKSKYPTLFVSAKNKTNIDQFKQLVYNEVKRLHVKIYPYNNFLWDDSPFVEE